MFRLKKKPSKKTELLRKYCKGDNRSKWTNNSEVLNRLQNVKKKSDDENEKIKWKYRIIKPWVHYLMKILIMSDCYIIF